MLAVEGNVLLSQKSAFAAAFQCLCTKTNHTAVGVVFQSVNCNATWAALLFVCIKQLQSSGTEERKKKRESKCLWKFPMSCVKISLRFVRSCRIKVFASLHAVAGCSYVKYPYWAAIANYVYLPIHSLVWRNQPLQTTHTLC